MTRIGALFALALAFAAGALVSGGLFPAARPALAQEQQQQTYVYMEEFTLAPGQSWNGAVREISGWVRDMRATGEFRSVRLFGHHTGPSLSFYVMAETDTWQAIDAGFGKFFAGRPNMMDEPFQFAGHSDNLLTEIPVN
jgi:hypothetical protein